MQTLYIGNLSFNATENELRVFIAANDVAVSRVKICTDRETGKSRGFGFIDVEDADQSAAIAMLDGQDFAGRTLRVREAEPKPERPREDRRVDRSRNRDLL